MWKWDFCKIRKVLFNVHHWVMQSLFFKHVEDVDFCGYVKKQLSDSHNRQRLKWQPPAPYIRNKLFRDSTCGYIARCVACFEIYHFFYLFFFAIGFGYDFECNKKASKIAYIRKVVFRIITLFLLCKKLSHSAIPYIS